MYSSKKRKKRRRNRSRKTTMKQGMKEMKSQYTRGEGGVGLRDSPLLK
jgi:hypothetical protein